MFIYKMYNEWINEYNEWMKRKTASKLGDLDCQTRSDNDPDCTKTSSWAHGDLIFTHMSTGWGHDEVTCMCNMGSDSGTYVYIYLARKKDKNRFFSQILTRRRRGKCVIRGELVHRRNNLHRWIAVFAASRHDTLLKLHHQHGVVWCDNTKQVRPEENKSY